MDDNGYAYVNHVVYYTFVIKNKGTSFLSHLLMCIPLGIYDGNMLLGSNFWL